jgi:hypothetical protein
MEIPTETAKGINPALTDLVSRSHVYKQIKEVSSQFVDFIIPYNDDITWTDLYIRYTDMNDVATVATYTLCVAIEGEPNVYALTQELVVSNRSWRPLPWVLPPVALNGQRLLLRLNRKSADTDVSIIKLLGFHGLVEKKERYVFVDRHGQYLVSLSITEGKFDREYDTVGTVLSPLYRLE